MAITSKTQDSGATAAQDATNEDPLHSRSNNRPEVKTMQVLGHLGQPGVPARFHAEEERRFAAEHAMEAAVAMARLFRPRLATLKAAQLSAPGSNGAPGRPAQQLVARGGRRGFGIAPQQQGW